MKHVHEAMTVAFPWVVMMKLKPNENNINFRDMIQIYDIFEFYKDQCNRRYLIKHAYILGSTSFYQEALTFRKHIGGNDN